MEQIVINCGTRATPSMEWGALILGHIHDLNKRYFGNPLKKKFLVAQYVKILNYHFGLSKSLKPSKRSTLIFFSTTVKIKINSVYQSKNKGKF